MQGKKKLFEQRFRKVDKIGEGSYGTVYKVELLDRPGTFYALKKFKFDDRKRREGFDFSALREITLLKELKHPNIESIIDTFYDGAKGLYIAFEYLDCDLNSLIRVLGGLEEADIKGIMYQLLCGLDEIHKNGILHRDLASTNVLINNEGVVKIGDFGLSRFIASPGRAMTKGVITMSFRAPEIFFLAEYYTSSADIWSAGCILAQMVKKKLLFQSRDNYDIEILTQIFTLLGIPTESNWPGAKILKGYRVFGGNTSDSIQKRFKNSSPECIDLLEKMLVLDPNKRISAEKALKHPFFTTEPLPSKNSKIAKIVSEYKFKNEKNKLE